MPPDPPERLPESARFYFDEDILGTAYAVMWLRDDVVTCGFGSMAGIVPRETPDVEWIPVVADLGLIAFTGNKKIRTNPYEGPKAAASGLRAVCVSQRSGKTSWAKMTLLLRHWQAIENFAAGRPEGPWWINVTNSGVAERPYRT